MHISMPLTILMFVTTTLAQTSPLNKTTHLIVPAVITHYSHTTFQTVIECWKLTSPFGPFPALGLPGLQGITIGKSFDLDYITIAPHFNGSLHSMPTPQLVHVLSGYVHVTLPGENSTDLWIGGGSLSLLIFADTTGMGHTILNPYDEEIVAVVASFKDGVLPAYEVLHQDRYSGTCQGQLQTFG